MDLTVTLRRAARPSKDGPSGRKGRRGRKAEPPVEEGRARFELLGAPLKAAGHVIHLDRELPRGGAEEYNTARKKGVRSFGMWTDAHRRNLWARVVTAPADDGKPMRYEVYGGTGEFVGSATREPGFTRGHVRTRWTVEQAGGPTAVGYKGRWFWWCVWWLIFPVQCVLGVAAVLALDGDLFRMPRRTGYRSGGTRVLDYGSGMQDHFHLTVKTADWDPRMLAALTALHCSHDGIMGEPWDKGAQDKAESAMTDTSSVEQA